MDNMFGEAVSRLKEALGMPQAPEMPCQQRMPKVKSIAEVKSELNRRGKTVAEVARELNVPPHVVYRVLTPGVATPRRGTAHSVAVQLGLKEGVL